MITDIRAILWKEWRELFVAPVEPVNFLGDQAHVLALALSDAGIDGGSETLNQRALIQRACAGARKLHRCLLHPGVFD